MITLTHKRPIGTISVTIHKKEEGCSLVRDEDGIFGIKKNSLYVPYLYEDVCEGIEKWVGGMVIQDALSTWDVQEREWLLAGIEPVKG